MAPQIEIVFCEGLQTSPTPNTPPTITNPLSLLRPYAIPGNYSFSVFCSIDQLPIDSQTKISIEIGETDGNILLPSTPIPINAVANGPGNQASIKLGIDLRNAIISKEGEIYAQIKQNNSLIGEKKIKVSVLQK